MLATRLFSGGRLTLLGLGVIAGAIAGAGPRWVIQPTPNPSRTSLLYAVSCSSRSACIAVGDYQANSGDYKTLAERWDGRSWTRQSTPSPAGTNKLAAVSCPRANYCIAVGSTGTGLRTLTERWNGSRWTIQKSGTGGVGWLTGISCTSPTACEAVGFSGSNGVLAGRWNGTKWKVQPTPSPAANSGFSAVSCPSAVDCIAVGFTATGGTLAEHWNGRKWALTATRSPGRFPQLDGVSCWTANACIATGFYQAGLVNKSLAERWNGHRWALQPTPTSTTGNLVDLAAVSCPSASGCIATGYRETAGGQRVLAEQWNGRVWAVQRTPNPRGTFRSQLNAVSCPSARVCVAVGSYVALQTKTLAEIWEAMPAGSPR